MDYSLVIASIRTELAKAEAVVVRLKKAEQAVRALNYVNGIDGAHRSARIMSASARRRISEAQKARWALWKKARARARA